MPSALSPISTPPSVADAADGEHECRGVARGPRHRRGHRDRAEELDRHALAEIDAIDGEVEERVHQRRRHAEDRRCDELRAGPAAADAARDGQQRERGTDDAEPGDRLWFDLVEERHGDRRADVLRQRRQDEERLRCRCLEIPGDRSRLVLRAHLAQSDSVE